MFTTCFINQRGFVLLKGKISYDKLNRISSFTKFKLNDESNFFFFYLTSCNYTMKNDPRKLITTPASPPENTSFFKK